MRVSRVGGRGGDSFLSPDLQREEIARVAAREGLDVVEVIEELDASGGDAKRPGWNRALEMVESGEVGAVVVWNLARFTRSVRDFLEAWDRIEAADARVVSASEDLSNKLYRVIMAAVAEQERDRARDNFAAATASAVERGIHVAGTVPLGYRRNADRRLEPDPDTAPVVRGLFERRAKGWSWAKLGRWAGEHGHDMSEQGVAGLVRNRVYLGEARYGGSVKKDAHEAIVPRALWQRCQGKRLPSARTGRLTEKFLLQGVALCASCSGAMYLSGSGTRNRSPYYMCRQRHCTNHAFAKAAALDAYVLNSIEEAITGLNYDGERVGPGLSDEAYRAATFVARPGAADSNIEESELALEEARADLEGYLSDTTLRRTLGAKRYNTAVADYVAIVNKAEADLAEARESNSGSWDLVGRLWNTEWGWAERKEWLERMVRSVVVSRGREPLSRRCEVELR